MTIRICQIKPQLTGWTLRRYQNLEDGYLKALQAWEWQGFYPIEISQANGRKGFVFTLQQHSYIETADGNPVQSWLRTRTILIERKTYRARPLGEMKMEVIHHAQESQRVA